MGPRQGLLRPGWWPLSLKAASAPVALADLLRHLRTSDRREVQAVAGRAYHASVTARFLLPDSDGYLLMTESGAQAVVWWLETHPGRYSVAMLARQGWQRHAPALSRWLRQSIIPQLLARGLQLASCLSDSRHHSAHRWLLWLGFQRCGRLPGYGSGGEDFLLFCFTAADRANGPAPLTAD